MTKREGFDGCFACCFTRSCPSFRKPMRMDCARIANQKRTILIRINRRRKSSKKPVVIEGERARLWYVICSSVHRDGHNEMPPRGKKKRRKKRRKRPLIGSCYNHSIVCTLGDPSFSTCRRGLAGVSRRTDHLEVDRDLGLLPLLGNNTD